MSSEALGFIALYFVLSIFFAYKCKRSSESMADFWVCFIISLIFTPLVGFLTYLVMYKWNRGGSSRNKGDDYFPPFLGGI